eukprot:6190560-Pleurochrysis_carterae.AAC.1
MDRIERSRRVLLSSVLRTSTAHTRVLADHCPASLRFVAVSTCYQAGCSAVDAQRWDPLAPPTALHAGEGVADMMCFPRRVEVRSTALH